MAGDIVKREKIFEIENNEELFRFKFEDCDILMWAFIRYHILISIYYKLYHVEEKKDTREVYIPQKAMLRYYLQTALKTPFCYRKKDILFLFSSASSRLNCNNKYEDFVFCNHFLAAKEKSTIIQPSYNKAYATPSIDDNLRFSDMIDILIKKESGDVSDADLKAIDELLCFIKRNSCVELDENVYKTAKKRLLATAPRVGLSVKYYKRLYESYSPKAIVLECAHYLGGYSAIKTAAAKDMGINVIEIQHGMLCNTYTSYNFGSAALNNKDFLRLLPDYYLLFGDYWKPFINTPVKCVTIGNPNFYKKAKTVTQAPAKTVLVLYNLPDVPHKCLSKYAIELAKQLPDYKITYRFHPYVKKNNAITRRLKRDNLKNLNIDTNEDIYTSFCENNYVIGDESTSLYEAACLKRKVYSIKTEANQNFIDPNLFTVFETPNELIEKIKNDEGIIIDDKTKESLFSSGFPGTYLKFLSDIGIEV